jgi:putative membrane protein
VLGLTVSIYLRGWWLLRRARVPFVPGWRAGAFLVGTLTLWVALASPLDTFSAFVLTAHMTQHMLLMMAAPPLILLGAPLIPMVRGMPIFAAREFASPFLNWQIAQRVGRALTHPVVASVLMGTVMLGWHVPKLYELALTSSSWHEFEHACFFLTSLIFWWPVVQPWPSVAQWPRWSMVPYLIVADVQNTILSAVLVFSDRVLYPSYAAGPRLFGFSALEDQAASGAIMWVVGSLAFVVPAAIIAVQCLSRKPSQQRVVQSSDLHKFQPAYLAENGEPTSLPRLTLPFQVRRSTFEAASFVLCFGLAGLCLMWMLLSPADDDDDLALRFSRQSGPFVVSVFALRGDLRPGPAPLLFLIQSSEEHAVLLDSTTDVAATSVGVAGPSTAARASHEASANKLMAEAELNLPTAGDWTMQIVVRRGFEQSEISFPLHVGIGAPESDFSWVTLLVPGCALLLLLVYLRRHRQSRAARMGRAVSSV